MSCICKWFDHDTLIVSSECKATDHGDMQRFYTIMQKVLSMSKVLSRSKTVRDASLPDPLIGKTFRVETSWGDDGAPWWVYRRVVKVAGMLALCHRFEKRAPQAAVSAGAMYVVYREDVIPIATLSKHESISALDWLAEWDQIVREIGSPIGCE